MFQRPLYLMLKDLNDKERLKTIRFNIFSLYFSLAWSRHFFLIVKSVLKSLKKKEKTIYLNIPLAATGEREWVTPVLRSIFYQHPRRWRQHPPRGISSIIFSSSRVLSPKGHGLQVLQYVRNGALRKVYRLRLLWTLWYGFGCSAREFDSSTLVFSCFVFVSFLCAFVRLFIKSSISSSASQYCHTGSDTLLKNLNLWFHFPLFLFSSA